MTARVSTSLEDGVAVLEIDNPPVNALGLELRQALFAELSRQIEAAGTRAIVITGKGRNFVAGADISELGKPPAEPTVAAIIALIESSGKPVVAAVGGNALGGGLELAMACHYRVAAATAQMGLPEVRLGIIPGAGGTQRLPRLVGAEVALRMIAQAQVIGAQDAARIGLLDAIAHETLLDAAVTFAQEKAAGDTHIPVRDRDAMLGPSRSDLAAFDAAAGDILARARAGKAGELAAVAVRNALTMPFDAALAEERRIFLELSASAESKALRHLFFAEREAAKPANLPEGTAIPRIDAVGVVGAGTMGRGIAMAFLNAGIPVTLAEASVVALDAGIVAIGEAYRTAAHRGSIADEDASARLRLLSGTTRHEDFAACDLVIEAVFEDMALKKQIFASLADATRPGTLLATNTSWLDVNEIAAASGRPADVLGLHFFSPANVMKLLEIVRGAQTAPAAVAAALAVARRIGKKPVVVGVGYGFVGNRMLAARSAELEALMLEGAMPREIDTAFRAFGWPMGPFEMTDLAGLDIGWRNRKAHGKTSPVADRLCALGRFGQKTGRGFHLYPDGARRGTPDPEVEATIRSMAEEARIAPRAVSAQEIIERTHYPLVDAGARVLDEGIATRTSDIDVVWVNGYGFPAALGGPMHWAQDVGLAEIVARLRRHHERRPVDHLQPSRPLLEAAERGGFDA